MFSDYVMSEIESDDDPMAICGNLTPKSSSDTDCDMERSDDEDRDIQDILKSTNIDTRTYNRASGY